MPLKIHVNDYRLNMTLCRRPKPDDVCETTNESVWKHCPENLQVSM